jgi:hypothetical protein
MKKLLIMLACLTMAACTSGNGKKIGTIVKLQQVGAFCKTWEAESIRGGYNGGSGVMGSVFDFTIEDPNVLKQVQEAMDSQREIELTYRKEGVTWCRSENEGNYFATSLRYLDREPTKIETETHVTGNVGVAVVPKEDLNKTSRDTKVDQLLATQAELIKELAAGRQH